LHTNPQLTPSQVAVALAGGEQGVQLVPHASVDVFDGHELPQRWWPALHTKSQDTPSQVAVALAGGTQGVQRVPQESTELLGLHSLPQWW
jgi:hypothetical protein